MIEPAFQNGDQLSGSFALFEGCGTSTPEEDFTNSTPATSVLRNQPVSVYADIEEEEGLT